MESLKALFWKPDPAVQLRKCNQLLRKNSRELDRAILNLKTLEVKTRNLIVASSKARHNTPAQTRMLAVELVRVRRQITRLATSRAQLQSIGMQINEAFSVRKIEGSIKASTGIMKDVNSLIRLPELTATMRELTTELIKSEVIGEMVDDSLPQEDEDILDEDIEEEVDQVLGEILQGRAKKTQELPETPMGEPKLEPEETAEGEDGLEDMRQRLATLKG